MEIYNSRGPKQTWHQNEATSRESKRNPPTREQMRLFASNIKELQQERIGAPSCGWTGEGGTLFSIIPPHEGGWGGVETAEHFAQIIFSTFSLLDIHVKILL